MHQFSRLRHDFLNHLLTGLFLGYHARNLSGHDGSAVYIAFYAVCYTQLTLPTNYPVFNPGGGGQLRNTPVWDYLGGRGLTNRVA